MGRCIFDEYMQQNYGLDSVIKPEVIGLGFEYVGTEYICGSQIPILRVYIDTDTGVDVEACQRVSKQINAVLQVEIATKQLGISKDYTLEVSSPGVNRKLFTAEQGIKQVGKQIKLVLKVPHDTQKRFTGTLKGVEGNKLIVLVNEQDLSFAFDNIEKAQIVPEW